MIYNYVMLTLIFLFLYYLYKIIEINNDWLYFLRVKLFDKNARIIYAYNGEHKFSEDFMTVARTCSNGNLIAYRFDMTQIGKITFTNDKELYYCGKYNWSFDKPENFKKQK